MALLDGLSRVADGWKKIAESASFSDICNLRVNIRDLERPSGAEPPTEARMILSIIGTLQSFLPPEHRVFESFVSRNPHRDGEDYQHWYLKVVEHLRSEIESTLAAPRFALHRQVQMRLLDNPTLDATEVVDKLENRDWTLIQLPTLEGDRRIPIFQFKEQTLTPYDIVLMVNSRICAVRNPFAAADWWLQPHAHLGSEPAVLLGCGQDDAIWQSVVGQVEAVY